MALTHVQGARQDATDAVVDLFDVGGGANATLEIGNGSVAGPTMTTVLSTHNMSAPAFGSAAASGTATAGAVADDASADATGTANVFRIKDKAGTTRIWGDVTATAGGGSIEINNTSINVGDVVSITDFLTYIAITP